MAYHSRDPALSAPLLWRLELVFVLLALGTIIASLVRNRLLGRALAVIPFAGLGLLGVVGLHTVLRDFWPSPRALISMGLWFAGVAACFHQCTPSRFRLVPVALTVLLAAAYVGIDARVNAEQAILNRREQAIAAAVAHDLRTLPDSNRIKRVVFFNGPGTWPDVPATFDMNISALAVPWSAPGLLRATSDLRVEGPAAGDSETAASRCSGSPHWPAPGSVSIDGTLAIVCF